MRPILTLLITCLLIFSCKSDGKNNDSGIENAASVNDSLVDQERDSALVEIEPITHATAVISIDTTTIYLDPTGGAEAFDGMDAPDLVLITDIHGDHLNEETLQALELGDTPIIAPQAVNDQLSDSLQQNISILANGDTLDEQGISIEAIPMYNLREEAKQFHEKGRGNGYVLEKNGTRIYIAGDTEDIPEMRALEDIDIAFIPMNLPYTMTVESAADAVLEFAPRKVYPYHFRGSDGMADVEKFKQLVNEGNKDIEVVMLEWYPEEE